MWNSANNTTTPIAPYVSTLSGPGFVVFNGLLFLVVLSVVVLNGIILVALVLETLTARVVRLVLGSILVSCLIVALGLIMYHISGIILNLAPADNPSNIPCTITAFLLGFGGAARLVFMATFAVTVYMVVRYHKDTTRKKTVCFAIIVLLVWSITFAAVVPMAFSSVVATHYSDKISCGTRPINLNSYIFATAYALTFGIGCFTVTTVTLITTVCYIRNRTITDGTVKKAMVKFGFFLLLGNTINIIGIIVPIIMATLVTSSEVVTDTEENQKSYEYRPFTEGVYVAYTLMNLSLIPTPVLILCHFSRLRKKVKSWLCFCCGDHGIHTLSSGSQTKLPLQKPLRKMSTPSSII